MDKYLDFISNRIYSLRVQNNISARKLSLDLELSNSYITQIENGKKIPSIETLIKICQYFNLDFKNFFSPETSNINQLPLEIQRLVEVSMHLPTEQINKLIEYLISVNKLIKNQ